MKEVLHVLQYVAMDAHHTVVDIHHRYHLWKGPLGMQRTESFI